MFHSDIQHNSISLVPHLDDKQKIADLWQEVFHDSDDFIELFFNRVYKPENTLVIKRDNRIISALQMIPYQLKIDHKIFPSAYICGVCTHPSERGKGIMNTLMTEAMEVMRQKGYLISTLIPAEPWLFDFYKKFGYTHPVNYDTETYSSGIQSVNTNNVLIHISDHSAIWQTNKTGYTFAECTTDKYFPYFDRKQHDRRCTVLHNKYDFDTIIRDLKYDRGATWVVLTENNPVGMAFAKPESGNTVCIKEIVYDNMSVKEALIAHILNQYHVRRAKIRIPFNPEKSPAIIQSHKQKTQPYGLACILDKQNRKITDLYMSLMLD
jgi:predicted acetyltransferase